MAHLMVDSVTDKQLLCQMASYLRRYCEGVAETCDRIIQRNSEDLPPSYEQERLARRRLRCNHIMQWQGR